MTEPAPVTDLRVTAIRAALARADAGHLEAAQLMISLETEGWSQRSIADAVGCSQATVSRHVTWYAMDPRPAYGEVTKRSSDSPLNHRLRLRMLDDDDDYLDDESFDPVLNALDDAFELVPEDATPAQLNKLASNLRRWADRVDEWGKS